MGWRGDSRHPEHHRNRNSQRADPRDTLCKLSECFCRREYLFHRCGLLRTDDACADVLRASRVDRAVPFVRELPHRNNSAHNCAAGLSHSRLIDRAETIHAPRDRSGRRAHFAVARPARRLVSLVVGEADETQISVGDADAIRDQPYSRSWNGTRQTRSSILVDAVRNDRDLRRMEPAMRWGIGG